MVSRQDGNRGWLLASGAVARDASGSIVGIQGTATDITERKQAEARLQLAASVFEYVGEGITITDTQGSIVDVNAAFTRITGYSREQAIGQNPRILKSGRQDSAFYETMWRDLTEQGHWNGEIWNRHQDGKVYVELLTIRTLRDAAGDVQQYVGLFSDITDIKNHQSQLEHLAHFDALTNLPNRVLLADRLQQAMAQVQRRQQRVAVVYLDLDGFKDINDSYGHATGGQVMGAEALIRWQHPEKGLLAPAAFLPVIEDHPLAIDVGEWVIDTALQQMEAWHAAGLDLPVSVNIGARQLQQTDFVERLQAILAKHPQVRPGCIELEILETSALSDIAQVAQVIDACAQIGVKFALDDFGTGYSSLTYLKRLRVATLKIDQSFVRDMLGDPDDLTILQGVVGLAAAFKREVIAGDVETVAHGTALLQLGCELAQGYGIARPMPADKMPAWAVSWRPDAAWRATPNLDQGSGSPEST